MNTLLFQRFQFNKPIEIEDLPEGQETVILALSDKIVIKMDKEASETDLAEILSVAKLGESDPLLATFFYPRNPTPLEDMCHSMFFGICEPLQDAWAYKIMRKYAPDIYETDINELLEYWEFESTGIFKDTGDPEMMRQHLRMFAILSENPANDIQLNIKTDKASQNDWERYINALKELIHEEPSANLYLRLIDASNVPFRVRIVTTPDGFRYYEVQITER